MSMECFLNDRMQVGFFIFLIGKHKCIRLGRSVLFTSLRAGQGSIRLQTAELRRLSRRGCADTHHRTQIPLRVYLSADAELRLRPFSLFLSPPTAEAAPTSVGPGTRSRSWKALWQLSVPAWTRGKTGPGRRSHSAPSSGPESHVVCVTLPRPSIASRSF